MISWMCPTTTGGVRHGSTRIDWCGPFPSLENLESVRRYQVEKFEDVKIEGLVFISCFEISTDHILNMTEGPK